MQRAGYKDKEYSQSNVQPCGLENDEEKKIIPLENQVAVITNSCFNSNENKAIINQDKDYQNLQLVPVSNFCKTKQIKKKDKFKKKLLGTRLIMKNSLQSKQQISLNSPEYIFRLIPQNKIFFIAGDILVEVKRKFDPELLNSIIFNEFRNIQSIEQNNLSFSLRLQSVKPMKMLSQVIYQLENSQDQDNFNHAQELRQHQDTILIIQDLIQQVIDSYKDNPEDLQALLRQREAYMLSEKTKLLEKVIQNDEFACIGSLVLSFENKAATVSHMSVTRPSIALIGGEDEFLIEYFLHKGFWNTYNFTSRRIIFEAYIKSQKMNLTEQTQIEDISEFVLEVPGFEVCSVDGIHIICNCTISSTKVTFPQDLQFKGTNSWLLNQIQSFFVVRFHISKQQIEQLLQLRHLQEAAGQSNIKEILEICNLEYDIKSQVFLEKYYKEHCYLLNNEKREKEMQENAIANADKLTCKYVLL